MKRTVILGNGDFPKPGGVAWELLLSARRVVACDGAGDAFYRRFGRWPEIIIGDMDSSKVNCHGATVVKISDQNTNDIEKAIDYCRKCGWKNPIIVGATGRREDHTLGNIARAYAHGLEVVTDFGRFVCVDGAAKLKVRRGTAISVFAFCPGTKVKSTGLEWKLDGVPLANLYCATLNRACATQVGLTTNKPIYMYIADSEE